MSKSIDEVIVEGINEYLKTNLAAGDLTSTIVDMVDGEISCIAFDDIITESDWYTEIIDDAQAKEEVEELDWYKKEIQEVKEEAIEEYKQENQSITDLEHFLDYGVRGHKRGDSGALEDLIALCEAVIKEME